MSEFDFGTEEDETQPIYYTTAEMPPGGQWIAAGDGASLYVVQTGTNTAIVYKPARVVEG